jgi:hypothetical protein
MKKLLPLGIFLLLFLMACLISLQNAQAQVFYGDTVNVNLPEAQKRAFIESIQQKIYYLQHYISKISDKSLPIEERLEMIDSAVKLFSSENNIVQVSNAATGEVTQLPVRQYFRRLANIKATRVDITFYKGVVLETLREATDGFYYGTAIMFQETVIYKDPEGMNIYRDKTTKRVSFKSKREWVREGDKKRSVMETLLENINIKETMPAN